MISIEGVPPLAIVYGCSRLVKKIIRGLVDGRGLTINDLRVIANPHVRSTGG